MIRRHLRRHGLFLRGFVLVGADQSSGTCREKQGDSEVRNPCRRAGFVRTELGRWFVVEVIVGVVMASGCNRVGVVRSAHGRRKCLSSAAKSISAARSTGFGAQGAAADPKPQMFTRPFR